MRDFLRRAFDRHPVLIFCLTAYTFSWFWVAAHLGPDTPPLFWVLYWLLGAGLGLWATKELMFTHNSKGVSFSTVR